MKHSCGTHEHRSLFTRSDKALSGCALAMLLSSCPLRRLAPAIRAYWLATITVPLLLEPVQFCFSKLLLLQHTPESPSFAGVPAHRSLYSSHAPEQRQG